MPWCPKCGAEFREGFTMCSSCQIPLEEKLHGDAPEAVESKRIVLYTVTGTLEADMLCELLRREGIAAYPREQTLGQGARLYTGASFFGTDIMIDADEAERARTVLNAYLHQSEAPLEEEELARQALAGVTEDEADRQAEEAKTTPREKRHIRVFRWLLTVDEIVALLAIVLAGMLTILRFISNR